MLKCLFIICVFTDYAAKIVKAVVCPPLLPEDRSDTRILESPPPLCSQYQRPMKDQAVREYIHVVLRLHLSSHILNYIRVI